MNNMESSFVEDVLDAFSKIKGEIDEKGGEFDFRYSLAKHFIEGVLGWVKRPGEGFFRVEEKRKDIIFYDDADPPHQVIIFETKKPSEDLSTEHVEQLENYLKVVGSVRYGVLTNFHDFVLYERSTEKGRTKVSKKFRLDVNSILEKKAEELPIEISKNILELEKLSRDRYIQFGDVEYFRSTYGQTSLEYLKGVEDIGYRLFIEGLTKSLEEITNALLKFFDCYFERDDLSGDFLRNSFRDWESWREFSGGKGEARDMFCRETAYIILNRILFARICEDKKISPQELSGKRLAEFLRRNLPRKKLYLEALDSAYKSVEQHYSHFYQLGILDWWKLDKEKKQMFSDEKKREQEGLEEELDFILGHTLRRLNRFSFKRVNRDLLGHVYEDYLSKEERKRLGEFYTPIEVVKYILDAVGYTLHNPIEGKDLLDPACGSGTFLVEAIDRLVERYKKKFGKKTWHLDELTSQESITILESIRDHIYGLDINPFACHIAEMNILFHIIDLYDNVRKDNPYYTLEKFNIYSTDSLRLEGIEKERQLFLEDFARRNGRAKVYLNEVDEIEEIKKMKFDFVVGNPPYVSLSMTIRRLRKDGKINVANEYRKLIDVYRKRFCTAFLNFDLYMLFLEKGLQWLHKNGKLGFICSDQFMTALYGRKLRKYIIENSSIKHIIDFGDSGVFKDVTNYPCILILQKSEEKYPFTCAKVHQSTSDILNKIRTHLPRKIYRNEAFSIFSIDQKRLSEQVWILASKEERTILKKMKQVSTHTLNKLCDFDSGIRTGKDSLFVVKLIEYEDEKNWNVQPTGYKKTGETVVIERDLLRPIIKGQNVRRWVCRGEEYVIFPHKEENGGFNAITEDEMKEKYPKAYSYFISHKSDLENRSLYRQTPVELQGTWFAIMHPGKSYEKPKILTPRLTNKSNFALDEGGSPFLGGPGGVMAIMPRDSDTIPLLLGLLNSKLYEFYLKNSSQIKAGKYYQFGITHLKSYPVKIAFNPHEKELATRVAVYVNQILGIMKQVSNLKEKTADFPDSYLSSDQKTETLPTVMRQQELSRDSYNTRPLRIESMVDLEGKTIYELHFTKKDYIAFDSENAAEFVLKMLKKKGRITEAGLLQLRLPKKEQIEKIMEDYKGDLRRMDVIRNDVRELENQIDDAVYELYELSGEEIKIIEKEK